MINCRLKYNKCLGYNIDTEIEKDNNYIKINQETRMKMWIGF